MHLITPGVDRRQPAKVQCGPLEGSHATDMNRRLSALVAVSSLLHAGLLWQSHPDAPLPAIGSAAGTLRITLTQPPQATDGGRQVEHRPAAAPQAANPAPRPAVAAHEPVTAVARTRAPTRTAPPSQQPPATRTQASPAPVTTGFAADAATAPNGPPVRQQVSEALQRQLAAAFDYPWLARKRGWQGLVTLSLHVAENGELSQWKVVRTSGYSLLDRSALQAAQRIGRLPQAEKLLNGRSFNLSIPVSYQLLGG